MTNDPNQSAGGGLYLPGFESDACGTGFVANLNGVKSHALVSDALTLLANMHHRGAAGCEENSGDGAGILLQLPHDFLQQEANRAGFTLPEPGFYGAGMVFFPQETALRETCRQLLNDYVDENGFDLLGYRIVPTDNSALGPTARSTEPVMEQVFVQPRFTADRKYLERRLYVLRKFAHHHIHRILPHTADDFYIASLSGCTMVFKGQLTARQLRGYFPDLADPAFASAIAVIHSRFSTNTVPKWRLAQPFRYIAHNGEINTIQGNIRWWEAREPLLHSAFFEDDELEKLKPICGRGLSDSGIFDNVLEFLHLAGRSLPHSLMMMIPEAWQHDPSMADYKRAFYEYHAMLMEPWDGPASICFTDGIVVGALLDRNGLRPSRYCLLDDGTLIVASEAGALPVDQARVIKKGRLQPGKILIADLDRREIVSDDEVKQVICSRFPYRAWLSDNCINLEQLNDGPAQPVLHAGALHRRQQLFGFTREDLDMILRPMAVSGEEPIGSMGADTPLAVLSQRPQHLAHYFKQLFAQVTNPPIDPIRERQVMSLFSPLGGATNPLDLDKEHPVSIHLDSPVLTDRDLAKIKTVRHHGFKSEQLDIVFRADGQKGRLRAALDQLCANAEDLVRNHCNLLVLSDRSADALHAPIPALLATGAVHQHLIRAGLRHAATLIIETGHVREVHHLAVLFGFGANAVNPYLAFASVPADDTSIANLIKAFDKGLLKIMSKMGVSTLQSYIGAQLFEAVGIAPEVIDRCFTGTVSRLGGLSFDDIAAETLAIHRFTFPQSFLLNPQALIQEPNKPTPLLPHGGMYQWQRDGEAHLLNPQTIHLLQHAVRSGQYQTFKKYSQLIDQQSDQPLTLRGLLTFRKGHPIPLESVEPVASILKRFSTGAMSFGSLSHEAHSTLAIAMNRIGAKSNSGEGGEDESRYEPMENGDLARSAVKQVASGRFGVTSWYLVNADELQIKMAQGAKPGEGGQLPGHKVDDWIARVRHATPGVGLISPPPHHDIYSIEDLAQLIFDLKSANPKARISVKLVSKAGVGIIASGVAKAKADSIMISGHDGGTGASPLGSIRHAGLPWELGLAETHQTLVRNGLRNRVVLQTDGQIRTGRDLAIATLLGAQEWSVATGALVAEGCVMMRKCHLNTCPVGIATQDPELRSRFTGKPEHIIHFFTFLAQELREIMAELGFSTVDEMVGRVEMLKKRGDIAAGKARLLDLSPLLFKETLPLYQPQDTAWSGLPNQNSNTLLDGLLDHRLIRMTSLAVQQAAPYQSAISIRNTDRAVGTMLSAEISSRWRGAGLPEGSLQIAFTGSAGQSFGAFSAKGLHFDLFGEANDYFGKGLSGARLVVMPDQQAQFDAGENTLIGNVALMGATSGEAYIRGQAGERFAVRNSGAIAVVEGVGDHGCEYMTGGTVLVLGPVGRNFGAGMTGGVAFVYDPNDHFTAHCNPGTVDAEIPEPADLTQIRLLIRNHFNYTGSLRALDILTHWDDHQHAFIRVMPREYKAVLAKNASRQPMPEPATGHIRNISDHPHLWQTQKAS
jgi:glutamate synthase (NADPH/NADH) large chain